MPDMTWIKSISILLTSISARDSVARMDKTARAELDMLRGDILTALNIAGDRSSDVMDVERAHRSGNVALLRLFLRFLPDRSIRFNTIRDLYGVLHSQAVADAEQQVTADRMEVMLDLWSKILDVMKPNPDTGAFKRLTFVVMTDVSDRALAERIVLERWPGSTEQAQGLLEEMKQSSLPLTAGSL